MRATGCLEPSSTSTAALARRRRQGRSQVGQSNVKLGLALLCAFLAVASIVGAQDPKRPAEMPPASFEGQQYVDSAGCLFLRAGTKKERIWIPRVARDGSLLCGYPPSGRRVSIAGEALAPAPPTVQDEGSVPQGAAGATMVAIGSFSRIENADRAERTITELGLPITRRQVLRNGLQLTSIFAGPFENAASARAALATVRSAGFSDAMLILP